MSLNNPTEAPYTASHTGLDRVVSNIQAALTPLTWLEHVHNRAWLLPESRGDELYRNPRIYSGTKEYWNVMPSDVKTGFSFCIGKGPAIPSEPLQPGQLPIQWTKRLDLIVFMNLQKIDPVKDYIFTEELSEQVMNQLKTVAGVTYASVWMEDIRDVYAEFDLSEIERDYLYYPFAGIRYELSVGYRIDTGEPGTGIICN